MPTLPNDAFVMLDPAVEILESEIAEYRLLCHSDFEVGMAVPPGEGLLDFVTELMERPVSVGDLRKEFDDQELIDQMLASLCRHGFAHRTSHTKPPIEEFARLRDTARQARKKKLRRRVVIDLDAPLSIIHLCTQLNSRNPAPEVLFRRVRLAEHKKTLAQLAHLRQIGSVHMHHAVI
jgi:hypothetical protein